MFTKYPGTMYTYQFSWRSHFISSNHQSIFSPRYFALSIGIILSVMAVGFEGLSVTTIYRIIGTKWTIHIICTLSQGPKKFGEIFESIPSIFEMILSRRLKDLQHDNLVKRTILTDWNSRFSKQNAILRVGVDEGGCSGLSYTFIVAK